MSDRTRDAVEKSRAAAWSRSRQHGIYTANAATLAGLALDSSGGDTASARRKLLASLDYLDRIDAEEAKARMAG